MRLATRAETREIDLRAQNEFGLPSEILMEAAGSRAALLIESHLAEGRSTSVGVICGAGGNGADGLVVARHLQSALRSRGGRNLVRIYLLAAVDKRTDLFQVQLERCKKMAIRIQDLDQEPDLDPMFSHSLLVDALFGVGLRDDLNGDHKTLIEKINKARLPVISLDTPSGLDVDRGIVRGAAIKAKSTLVFGTAKPGFFMNDGPSHVGQVKVVAIGFAPSLMREVAQTCSAFTEKSLRGILPPYSAVAHKTQHGHALLIAGSPGMWGAGLLSSSSAYRIGAGYVTLASFVEPDEVLRDTPEILTSNTANEKLWKEPKWTACGIGPGLGTEEPTRELIEKLIALDRPCVLDADALTVIAKGQIKKALPAHWIATPHAGELSRLIGVDAKTIESDRIRYALEGSRKLGCYVLLKGFRTVVADAKKGCTSLILSGNSALGKAGSGDVLTGMTTGLLAQKVNPWKAASAAAYIHGRLSDEWVKNGNDRRSLEASDLRLNLPSLLARLAAR